MIQKFGLPIDSALPELIDHFSRIGSVVLQAPPGAGKSTCVPLALLDQPWLSGKRIIMLEPRRLAVRTIARRMAALCGEAVGRTVGYRIRFETRVGPETRLEIVTEGVLTRMLQSDPSLAGTGLVIFDEFHERSLQADLGLALCLECQAVLREDLRLLVMSATLDAEMVAALMGSAPVVSAAGKSFDVQTRYSDGRSDKPVEQRAAAAVRHALKSETGSILVFLPGEGEIRRTASLLEPERSAPAVEIVPLYGNLSRAAQDQAIVPAPAGRRKVVLASAIAETSLT
ncbi:MAG: DEAD/DEAH box helicase, partial [Deltaproteobacteria bacterium]|nr:DEAD/DEAH box helicase [Deltaproteobacteria bacterium]